MFNKITNLISITTISILLSCIFSSNIYAQTELFGFGGYQVASDVQTSEGDLNIYSNPNYGAGIDFEIERGTQLELLWIGQKTFAELQPYTGGTIPLFNVFIHYFQGGILYEFRRTRAQKAFPFMSFSMGATVFHPEESDIEDEWRFSITFGVGGKFYLSDNVGLRLQTRLLLPLTFSSAGMWCGTGGCSFGVGSWATFVQADFTGGIFVRLGK